jgi:tetratricopeptide (TPR) repeat protein
LTRKQKRKSRRFPQAWKASPQQIETRLDAARQQLVEKRYKAAVQTARLVLRHVPANSKPAGEAYDCMGVAYSMLQEFYAAYESFSKALDVLPDDAAIWYNRAGAARFTMRFGQSVRDLERALELGGPPRMRKQWEEELAFIREIAQKEMALRGPAFTLDDLIEQQELFQSALHMMEKSRWAEAEPLLRRVIEMGDCHPQPWGNLAGCLMMQQRYDEAEQALRRALEIDPEYDLALQNLALLPTIRQTGISGYQVRRPFEGRPLKQEIKFVEK